MNKIKDNLPILSALLLILGSIRLVYYYAYFGIDIISYIDLSEILILSVSFFFNSFMYVIFILFLGFIIGSKENGHDEIDLNHTPLDDNDISIRRYFYWTMTWLCLFAQLGLFVFGPSRRRVGSELIIATIVCLFFLPPIIPNLHKYITNAYNTVFNSKIKDTTLFTGICVLVLLLQSFLFTRLSARHILFSQYTKVEIALKEKIIRTDPLYRFVGKTKNYAFFYNKITNKSESIPLNDVKSISIINTNTDIVYSLLYKISY